MRIKLLGSAFALLLLPITGTAVQDECSCTPEQNLPDTIVIITSLDADGNEVSAEAVGVNANTEVVDVATADAADKAMNGLSRIKITPTFETVSQLDEPSGGWHFSSTVGTGYGLYAHGYHRNRYGYNPNYPYTHYPRYGFNYHNRYYPYYPAPYWRTRGNSRHYYYHYPWRWQP